MEGPNILGETEQMLEQELKSMKVSKVPGPSRETSDFIKVAGATRVKRVFLVCEFIEQEGRVPEQWGKSFTIPVYKGKGNVLMVDKHRSKE